MNIYRHILPTILVAAILMLAGGCVHEFPKEDTPQGDGKGDMLLHMRLHTGSMPLYKVITVGEDPSGRGESTRAATTVPLLRYIVEVYPSEETPGMKGSKTGSTTTGGLTRSPIERKTFYIDADKVSDDQYLEMRLEPGTYKFYVWADYTDIRDEGGKGLYYDATDLADITVVAEANGEHRGTTDLRQAFRGHTEAEVPESALDFDMGLGHMPIVEIPLDMKRPLARFLFISTDVDEFLNSRRPGANRTSQRPPSLSDYMVKVRYSGYMPIAFNAFTDRPFDSRLGQWFESTPQAIDSREAMLGFDYMFVNGAEAGVQLAVEIYDRQTGEKIGSSATITAPLKRGKTTEIRGRFLTSKADAGVGINPDFDGDYNIEIK